YAATGTLPDLVDEKNIDKDGKPTVTMSGEARLAKLREHASMGDWPAANTVCLLIDARRSALAATRAVADVEMKGATTEAARAGFAQALAENQNLDRHLVALRTSTMRDVSTGTERVASAQLTTAHKADAEAEAARKAGNDAKARALEAKAEHA